MLNLLKKSFSILTVLVMMLCGLPAFADEAGANCAAIDAGRGTSGTLSPGEAVEIKVYADRGGQVRFVLTLTEDCGVSVSVDSRSADLTRLDSNPPVYAFAKYFEQGEYHVISMTADQQTGFSLSSELIPEEPAPEIKPEEVKEEAVPAAEEDENPVTADLGQEPAAEPEVPETDPEPDQQEPAAEPEISAADPEPEQQEPAAEPEDPEADAKQEQQEPAEEPEADQQEPAAETEAPVAVTEPEQEGPAAETDGTGAEPEIAGLPPMVENETEEQSGDALPEHPKDEPEDAANSIEIIIAKSLTPDESWNGTVRNRKPTILKLDVASAGTIHMLVEGRNICYSVQKSDRITEDAGQVMTDAATRRSITTWAAEAGSYLISIRAGENSLAAKAAVTFMNDEEFEAWEAEQAEPDDETANTEEIITEDSENRPESENAPERSIDVEITWDVPDPVIGATAHFTAGLNGYEGLNYTVQWQYSPDKETWYDLPGETEETMDVTVTEENNLVYWRIQVFVEDNQEN